MRATGRWAICLVLLLLPGCGGNGGVEPGPVATSIAPNGGNNQSAAPGFPVPTSPSVSVTDANAEPVSGIAVTFAVASGGGSLTGVSQTTNSSGVATVGSWTLGPGVGNNTLTATAAGLAGSPVTFTALAEGMSVTAVSPWIGSPAGGTSVTITGTGFIGVTGVTVGGGGLGNLVVSPTQITGTTAAGSAGTVDVVVSSSSHGSATCTGCFAYADPVALTGFANGGVHTCALTAGGVAYCWGWNEYGQLGTGGTASSSLPVPVEGAITFSTLAAGGAHTCGLTPEGAAYCWGSNRFGQLGNGSTEVSDVPVPVSGGLIFTALTAGGTSNFAWYGHTCGLTSEGKAYCWGDGGIGQLGHGAFFPSSVPVAVQGGLTFRQLAAGDFYTCGLTTSGAAYCWGSGETGHLGNGSNQSTATPVAVSGGLSFSTLSAGGDHTCALTSAGVAYCWGWNDFGQLGDGTEITLYVPVRTTGGHTFAALAIGGGYSCALTAAGVAYCWGRNQYGQVGNGANTDIFEPTLVRGDLTFSTLGAGGWHTCGPTTQGDAYCWGNNEHGQLGNGSDTNSNVPVPMSQ